MKELMEYREKLLVRLVEATDEFCAVCRSFTDLSAKADGEWSVHQIASHVRDINREVYGMRIRRTLNEENPLFKNFDPEAWMATKYDRDEAMEKILNEFSTNIHELHGLLVNLPQEGWSRLSQHEALGKELTLQLWTERCLAHIGEHLAALKNAQNV